MINSIEFKKVLLVTISLVFLVGFFNPVALPQSWTNAISLLSHIVLVGLFVFSKKRQSTILDLINIVAVVYIISMVAAYIVNDQDPLLTIRAANRWLGIFYAFFLLRADIKKEDLYNGMMLFFFIWIVCYIVSLIAMPTVVFHNPYEDGMDNRSLQRGFYRIYVTGSFCNFFLFFWNLQKYADSKIKKYLIFAILAFVAILTTLSRQNILLATLFFIYVTFKEFSVSRKIIVGAVLATVMFYYVPKTTIFQTMTDFTQMQMEANNGGKDDIRAEAYRYYLSYNNGDIIPTIFGNGFYHYESEYGKKIERIISSTGMVLADVGVAAFYFYFGLLGLFLFGKFFYKIIKYPKDKELRFVNYYILYAIAGTVFSNLLNNSMVCVSIALYLLYLNNLESSINK